MKPVQGYDISSIVTEDGSEILFHLEDDGMFVYAEDYDKLLKEFNEFKEKHGKVN